MLFSNMMKTCNVCTGFQFSFRRSAICTSSSNGNEPGPPFQHAEERTKSRDSGERDCNPVGFEDGNGRVGVKHQNLPKQVDGVEECQWASSVGMVNRQQSSVGCQRGK